jgi:hypothetical protein
MFHCGEYSLKRGIASFALCFKVFLIEFFAHSKLIDGATRALVAQLINGRTRNAHAMKSCSH